MILIALVTHENQPCHLYHSSHLYNLGPCHLHKLGHFEDKKRKILLQLYFKITLRLIGFATPLN